MPQPRPGSFPPSVSLKELADNFGVIAEAEGGIKKLRELVLALAVRGALVPQIAEEGTAQHLVGDLQAARGKLAATVKVRSDLAPVTAEEEPFAVPSSWRWVRLGQFGGFLGGGTPSKSNASFWSGSIPWVSPKDMKRAYINDAEDHISEAAVDASAVKLIPKRSVLLVVRGMILAHSFPVALTTRKVTINQDMKALVLGIPDTDEYLLRACWAARSRVLERVERSSHGTCRLESNVVEELPIPLPPIAEQNRIVAKVDELMHLLDNLEAKQTKKRETQARLRNAALGSLMSAEGSAELAAAWKRVADNFEVLFESCATVGELRTAIFDLAARGRITAQDPCDAPVPISARVEGVPFRLPSSWRWASPDEVCAKERHALTIGPFGSSLLKSDYSDSGVPLVFVREITSRTFGGPRTKYVSVKKANELRAHFVKPGDLLITKMGSPPGDTALYPLDRPPAIITADCIKLTPNPELTTGRFLQIVFEGEVGRSQFIEITKGVAHQKVSLKRFRNTWLPLPPIAEQKRIVAKVDQLMKLCDELEAKLLSAEAYAGKLVGAVVAEIVGELAGRHDGLT
jgi:type I restriction enzyme S subunit